MKPLLALTAFILISNSYFSQGGVGINNTGNSPDASSMLDVQSSSKGVLLPRVALTNTTDATTISNGNVTSLLVYNTATVSDVVPGYYYWDGAIWKTLGGDADSDPTNEIQDLTLNTTTNILTITNNGSATNIDLSTFLDNTDAQTLSLSGNTLSISNGNNVTLVDNINDADSDPTNEIELPATATTGQVLSWDGSNWVAQNPGSGADNWGNDVVNTLGANISGNGTSGSPLIVTDADSNPTNEIELPTGGSNGQVLSTNGSGTYSWINDATGTDNQILSLSGNTLSISNGNNVTLVDNINDADSDPTNEIELPATATTGQVLSWDGSNWVAQNPGSGADNWGNDVVNTSGTNISGNGTSGSPLTITEVDGDITNELQDLSLTGNTLSLTNDGTTVDLSSYLDNTDNQNISGSSFNAATGDLVIGIQNGTSETINIKDHDWYEVGGTSAPDNINDNIFTNGKVGIKIINPVTELDVNGETRLSDRLLFRDVSEPTLSENFSIVHRNGEMYFQPVNNNFISGGGDIVHFVKSGNSIGQVIFGNVSTSDYTAYFDMTTNKTGLGTNNPTERLEVNGSVKIVDGTQAAGKVLTSDATGKASWQYGGVPPGAIMAFNSFTCPAGWVPANGAGGTPDLRGEFIRGYDAGRGADPGRILGSFQTGSKLTTDNGSAPAVQGLGNINQNSLDPTSAVMTINYTFSGIASGNFGAPYVGMVRPRNVAFLYCIKQ